jgi:hypothetical protein
MICPPGQGVAGAGLEGILWGRLCRGAVCQTEEPVVALQTFE